MKTEKYITLILLLTCLAVNNTIAQNELTDIQSQAKTDALWDLDAQKWFQIGMCFSSVGISSGCVVSMLTATDSGSSGGLDFGIPEPNLIGFAVTALGVAALSNLGVAGASASVPPERLLGLPASDIETYSKTYIDTVNDKRIKYSLYGTGATCLGVSVISMIIALSSYQ